MKKILQLTMALALGFSAADSKAQVVDGTLSADWTYTDINGVSHNLYTYLNAGKTVFIDISATWCWPCWEYHHSGALDSIWTNRGPAGAPGVSASTTNDCMVFFIEGDGATSSADLHGTGGNTQGDWVTGTNYPIIDPPAATVDNLTSMYNLAYFPSGIMICPDRIMKQVDFYSAAQLTTARTTCEFATAATDAQMMVSTSLNGGLGSCDSVTPIFSMSNLGTNALTSATITYEVDGTVQKTYNWTGNIPTYQNTNVTGIKLGAPTVGTHTITATVSNPNGVTDPTAANNATSVTFKIYPAVGGAYVTETFQGSSAIPATWEILGGSSASTWHNAITGYYSTQSAILDFYHLPPAANNDHYLTMPKMSFGGATSVQLTFDVSYAQYTNHSDQLEVLISTDCGLTWTSVYSKAGSILMTHPPVQGFEYVPAGPADWRHEIVSLTSYAGQQNVTVRFKGTSDFGNNLYLDNVNVIADAGANDASISSIVYPSGPSFACNATLAPVVALKSFGTNPLTSCTLNYNIDGGTNQTYSWTGNLTTGQSANVTLPNITVTAGTHSFMCNSSNPNAGADASAGNDQSASTFSIASSSATPVVEGLENATFPPTGWFLSNPDNDLTWARTTAAHSTGSASMWMDNTNYASVGAVDEFTSNPVDLSNASSAALTFQVAYQMYSNPASTASSDSLKVFVSTNCGTTWSNVYSKGKTTLTTTTPPFSTNPFTPTANQWRLETVDLSSYASGSTVVKFWHKTDYENNMYVDDINITATVGVNDITLDSYVSVFPNPTAGNVYVNVNAMELGQVNVKVYNVMGEVISELNDNIKSAKKFRFDLSGQPNGMYFVEVKSAKANTVKKVMLNK